MNVSVKQFHTNGVCLLNSENNQQQCNFGVIKINISRNYKNKENKYNVIQFPRNNFLLFNI
jgi:hypothetical protein